MEEAEYDEINVIDYLTPNISEESKSLQGKVEDKGDVEDERDIEDEEDVEEISEIKDNDEEKL